MVKRIALMVAFVVVLVLPTITRAQDPVEANPGKYTVLFENDRVRLLEYRDAPGDESAPHQHPDHLVYSLSDWEREFILEDGTVVPAQFKVGDFMWVSANRHSARNTGKVPTHALIFELKSSANQDDLQESQAQ